MRTPARRGRASPLNGARPELERAEAIRDYPEMNPKGADQPPGWAALTLWAHELYPGKPTSGEAKAALGELGGEDYGRTLLECARSAA